MNTRNDWMDNLSADDSRFYTKEETIAKVQSNFDYRRYNTSEGESVTIDGISEQVLIQSHTNPLNEKKEDKKMLCTMTSNIKKGSEVVWGDEIWYAISRVDNVGSAYKSTQIYKANNVLNFYKNNVLYSVPCIVGNQVQLYSMKVEETKYNSYIANENILNLPINSITSLLEVNDTFKMGKYNYQVQSISDIIVPEFLIVDIKVVFDAVEIPTIPSAITTGIVITGESSIIKSYTENYSCVFKVNNAVVADESVFYLTGIDETSPTTLAEITTQDGTTNTCTIKGIDLGTVLLWVKNVGETKISEPMEIQIERIF